MSYSLREEPRLSSASIDVSILTDVIAFDKPNRYLESSILLCLTVDVSSMVRKQYSFLRKFALRYGWEESWVLQTLLLSFCSLDISKSVNPHLVEVPAK